MQRRQPRVNGPTRTLARLHLPQTQVALLRDEVRQRLASASKEWAARLSEVNSK